ncbi:SMC family ATPase [Streptomyces sp. AJS327]|uniref:AAA family ATPase n=1 Tax=Streptomyces sp. AJS327 TaxID=2545265 RepID=UPI0015DE5D56|nr:SMC family ATPase [Streptomyces sp. AJS327]MBA0051147.1 SMC family ATPase [Streptomyces sp. AJS327]
MRLHHLELTAFGPFGGRQRVDFDALSAAGLFLLHGATGAGKTSVLDAVCYALYGGVPGARQQPGGSLRSDHADPHVPTRVVLEFSVAGRRLELTRAPDQPRPRKRGGGTTREKAVSQLRELDPRTGEWQPLSRSHQEIGGEIEQLLGMNREQFCQVVLLPQGDFARFLRAGAEERGKLLGRLFDTGRFSAVEERLHDMRREAQQRVRGGDEALLALAQRMRQAMEPLSVAGPPPGAELAQPGGDPLPGQRRTRKAAATTGAATTPGAPGLAEAVLEWAARAREQAREWHTVTGVAVRTAEDAHRAAAHHLDEAGELDRRQRRYAEASRRAAELRDTAPERERAERRLASARAAGTVIPLLRLRSAAEAEHTAARAAARRGWRSLTAEGTVPDGGADGTTPATPAPDGPSGEPPRPDPDALAAWERAARQELGALAGARRAERRCAETAEESARLEREGREDESLLREAGEWLEGWEARRHALLRRVDGAQEAATRAEHLAGRLAPARDRLAAGERRDAARAATEEAERELPGAREESAAAREHWLDLRERRLRGVAAELAAGLEPGSACAVCGSTRHPDPARASADHVDRATEDEALAAYQRAEKLREEAERRHAELRETLSGARAAAGDAPLAELAADVAELESAHAAAHAEASGAHAAREALESAEREHAERLAQQGAAERRTAARASRRETLQREQLALEGELRQARGGAASVAERAAALERRAERCAAVAEAVRLAHAAERRRDDAAEQLAGAVTRAGFGSAAEAEAAVLGEPEQRDLAERLDRRRAEEAAVAAELADPDLAGAAAVPPARLAEARDALEAATARLRAASAAGEAARTRCAELDRLSRQSTGDARRLAPLRVASDRVSRLSGLAAGTSAENERKMRLESYVLAARLEQVAAAASERLARMSTGRYSLVHSDRISGRARSGLGLHVIDAWTGAERDTATLSGGETFFASLALALGLADVVADEAGGTRLDTLFVDEGFGSLDAETLDEVLDVLDALRERDRCVGIVSHVPELRQRIPARLEVTKARRGSGLRHRTAPDGS